MNEEEQVLRCAYEESALREVAAEVGSWARAREAVLDLVSRGLVRLYRESGWPRIRREPIADEDVDDVLERPESWDMPAIGDDVRTLHARFVGLVLTDAGSRTLKDRESG